MNEIDPDQESFNDRFMTGYSGRLNGNNNGIRSCSLEPVYGGRSTGSDEIRTYIEENKKFQAFIASKKK